MHDGDDNDKRAGYYERFFDVNGFSIRLVAYFNENRGCLSATAPALLYSPPSNSDDGFYFFEPSH